MSNLNDSLKTPVVFLYDDIGTLLFSTMNKLDLDLVEFSYQYDDDDEDKCTIKIQAKNYKSLDLLNIGRNDKLKIQWGYLTGPYSPMVTVAVRDINSKYGINMIYIEYQCTDLTTYLKTSKPTDLRKTSLIGFINDYASLKCNIVIQSGTDIIFKQLSRDPNEEKPAEVETMGIQEYFPIVFDPWMKNLSKFGLGMGYNNLEPPIDTGTWFVNPDNIIRQFYEKEIDISSVNRSPYTVIQENLNHCPYGPWYITGRGNTLFIHNRNLGNVVYTIYSYAQEPGYLQDFTPKTKYDSFEQQVILAGGMDPITKGSSNLESYISKLSTMKSIPEIMGDRALTKKERENLLKDWVFTYRNTYQDYKVLLQVFDTWVDAQKGSLVFPNNIRGRNRLSSPYKTMTEMGFVPEGERNDTHFKNYGGKVLVYSMPMDDLDDLQTEQENGLRKLEMETEEAEFIIEGDPSLMSEFVIGINNVSKVHKGNYYVKKCEHMITEMGYKTTLDTLKVKNSSIIRSLKSQSEFETDRNNKISLKLNEFWLRQQEIFKKWDITYNSGSTSGHAIPGAKGAIPIGTPKYSILNTVDDLTKNDDQVVTEIMQYYNNPSLGNRIEERDIYSPENR